MGSSTQHDMAGIDLIVNNLRVGATAPGATGSLMSGSEITVLDGVVAGTVTASKAVVVDASKNIASFGSTAQTGTLTVGVDDTGADVTFYGATSGKSFLWDESADKMIVTGDALVAGTTTLGANATDRVAIKGIYMSPANVAVTVPAITDPDIAKVDVDVSGAFSMQPAVGDAVIAMPQEDMEANARILNAYVTNTDQITVVFGSEGGNVTGGAKNFKFLVIDVT